MALKKHDFVEIEYTGRLDDGTIFDTTDEKTAKDADVARENSVFGPVVVCIGEEHVIKGIEEKLVESKIPSSIKLNLQPEKAFGKKDAKMLKLMPMKVFRKQEIQPFLGLEVNIDNHFGTVRSVSGGRVIVDFNHPLAGRVLNYEIKIKRIVEDTLEKAKAVFKNELNITDAALDLKNKTLLIGEEKFPKEVLDAVKKRVTELIPEINEIMLKKDFKESKPKAEKKGKTALEDKKSK